MAHRSLVALAAGLLVSAASSAAAIDPITVHVFHRNAIHFTPDDTTRYDTETVTARDNGREIQRTIELPDLDYDARIVARVTLHPIPKDPSSVHDKWDRAANVRLVLPDAPDVEIVKLITAYGGETSHEVDVSHLAPLLRGSCTFRGFVDTWVTPAWKMDFALDFEPRDTTEIQDWMEEWIDEDRGPADWVLPVAYANVDRALMDEGPVARTISVPEGVAHAVLYYLVSGHCTDGRGADEFESKDHVIAIDGREVHRFRPWRDDCRAFREVNPYCRRWFEGSWSSDFSRSGWCPGDEVDPVTVDVTEPLTPGEHEVTVRVEDVRPEDESGKGYWRVSAVIVGWDE